jgi:hypothetical protein
VSELATCLIAEVQADCSSRLEAIKAYAGQIEEAESLAATLRSKGLDVVAAGHSFAAWINSPGYVITWVSAHTVDAEALLVALREADLVIGDISAEHGIGYLQLQGLKTRLHVSGAILKSVLGALRVSLGNLVQAAKESAHG